MRKIIFVVVAMIMCGLFCTEKIWAQGGKQSAAYADMAAEVLRLVNEHRAGMGLPPLTANDVITRAATQHSSNMATKKIPFSHDGFDGRMAGIAKQVRPATAFAENVAYGAKTAQEAMDMWLHSEGHRKNIEGGYNRTGIGIVKGADGNLYFTEIFVQQSK